MSVDAIGTSLNPTDPATTTQNTVNQSDFIKLFLAQLQFQDPLQPVDNQEFLAQLAQFSNLQQTQQTSQNTQGLLVMNSSAQALALLNRNVEVQFGAGVPSFTGSVIAVTFDSSGPMLSVQHGTEVKTNIRLSQVSIVGVTL